MTVDALRLLAFLAAAGVAGACVPVPADLPEERFTAALVDSVAWRGETLRRVEVRGDSSVDTIPGVLTARPVVTVPRMGVYGFAFDTAAGAVRKGFRYEPRKGRVKDVVLAPDLAAAGAAPALSPDGRYVAYAVHADGRAHAAVRVFPRGRIVFTGPGVEVPPGGSPRNGAAWSSPDSFAVHLDLGGRRLRVRGTVRGGVHAVDTVAAAP